MTEIDLSEDEGLEAIVFDTETTDLIRNSAIPLDKQPRCYEFCSTRLKIVGGVWTEVEKVDLMIHPGIAIPAESSSITGVTDAMVANEPRMIVMFPKIVAAFQGVDISVAHNHSYDTDIINFESRRVNERMVWPAQQICTVEATHHIMGRRLNLSALYEYLFDERFVGAHRGRQDVDALTRCFVELWNRNIIR